MDVIKQKINKMNRLTSLVAAVMDLNYSSIRGFDTEGKVLAAYMVKKILGYDNGNISAFFRIPVEFMKNKWEDLEIKLQFDENLDIQMASVVKIWESLTVSEKAA